MPFNIGPGELILILIIALVVLGPGKLPDVAQSLGKSVREFRKAATDVTEAGKLDAGARRPIPAAAPARAAAGGHACRARPAAPRARSLPGPGRAARPAGSRRAIPTVRSPRRARPRPRTPMRPRADRARRRRR